MTAKLSRPALANDDFEIDIDVVPARPRARTSGRLASLVVLASLVALVAYALSLAYRAITDAYVAPLILSPDNDLILDYKQKVLELDVQLGLAKAQAEGLDADLSATEAAEKRLTNLYALASGSLRYTSAVNSTQLDGGTRELDKLDEQRGVLEQIYRKQKEIADRTAENFRAGLVTQSDLDREVQSERQAQLALLENGRSRNSAEERMNEALLGKTSITGSGAAMPEVLSRQAQMVQVQLELIRIQAETRSKRAEHLVLQEQIERIGQLERQLQSRPIFRAMEKSLFAAFVPYTQIDSVRKNAAVYRCQLGFFRCQKVGRVSEIVPGEVSAPDPWGSPARGQYILLELTDNTAATAKVLRVRPNSPRRKS